MVLAPVHGELLDRVHRGEQQRYRSPYYAPDRADVIRHAAVCGVEALCAGAKYDLAQLRAVGGKRRLSIRTSSALLARLTEWAEQQMSADVGVQGLDTTGLLRLALVVGLVALEREQAPEAPAPAPAPAPRKEAPPKPPMTTVMIASETLRAVRSARELGAWWLRYGREWPGYWEWEWLAKAGRLHASQTTIARLIAAGEGPGGPPAPQKPSKRPAKPSKRPAKPSKGRRP